MFLSSIVPDALELSLVTVFPIGNPTQRFADCILNSAVAFTVLDVIAADALLVLPKKIFFTKLKSPVGVADIAFVVVNDKVFCVTS